MIFEERLYQRWNDIVVPPLIGRIAACLVPGAGVGIIRCLVIIVGNELKDGWRLVDNVDASAGERREM